MYMFQYVQWTKKSPALIFERQTENAVQKNVLHLELCPQSCQFS